MTERIKKQEFFAAFERLDGDRDQIAEYFGVHPDTAKRWAKAWGLEFRRGNLLLSDEQVLKAYEECRGHQSEMAKMLGVATVTIYKAGLRLGLEFRRGRKPSKIPNISKEEFHRICDECKNHKDEIAARLEVTPYVVAKMAKMFNRNLLLLHQERVSDQDFKIAFSKHNGDCALVGKELGYNPVYVHQRAIKLGVLEQKEHYVWTKKRVVVSDEQILDALEKTGGKKGEAARLLDITKVTLFLRMRKMKEQGLIPA